MGSLIDHEASAVNLARSLLRDLDPKAPHLIIARPTAVLLLTMLIEIHNSNQKLKKPWIEKHAASPMAALASVPRRQSDR